MSLIVCWQHFNFRKPTLLFPAQSLWPHLLLLPWLNVLLFIFLINNIYFLKSFYINFIQSILRSLLHITRRDLTLKICLQNDISSYYDHCFLSKLCNVMFSILARWWSPTSGHRRQGQVSRQVCYLLTTPDNSWLWHDCLRLWSDLSSTMTLYQNLLLLIVTLRIFKMHIT